MTGSERPILRVELQVPGLPPFCEVYV
eukprot:COSAG05_NODE_4171_length_1641_cov_72.164073_3_plen_26_part_01